MAILFAEDDMVFGKALCKYFMGAGVHMDWVTTGSQMIRAAASTDYQCIVLDNGLPDIGGDACLVNLRALNDVTPVIIQTARDDRAYKLRMLELGADDYLVKPYDLGELLTRVRAVVRRSRPYAETDAKTASIGGGVLDLRSKSVLRGSERIDLTAMEFTTLELLIRNRGRLVTRAQLEASVYGWTEGIKSNAIEVHIHNLRRKLGSNAITTVRGIGYQCGE